MRIVRNRRDARWLPSRFHFALFRLFAYLRLRMAKPECRPGLVLAVDRHQSAAENYLVSICIFVVATSFAAAMLSSTMSLPVACVIAVPAAAFIIQVPFILSGTVIMPIVRKVIPIEGHYLSGNSAVLMLLMIGAAIFILSSGSPGRVIAAAFLLLVALNAMAALLVFLLRGAIANEERRFGAEP